MNGCISTNLEVNPIDSSQLVVVVIVVCAYARDRYMKMAHSSENGLESARCSALILTLNSVGCTQIYL